MMNANNQVNVEEDIWLNWYIRHITKCSGFLINFFPLFCPYFVFILFLNLGFVIVNIYMIHTLYTTWFWTFSSINLHDRWVQSIEGLRLFPSTRGAQTWWSWQPQGWRTWSVEPVADFAACCPQGLLRATPPRGRCRWRLPEPWTSSWTSHDTKHCGCFWGSHPRLLKSDPDSWQNLGLQPFPALPPSSWPEHWSRCLYPGGRRQGIRGWWLRMLCSRQCCQIRLGIASFCCWLSAPSQMVLSGRHQLQSLKIVDWIENML